MTYTPGTRPIDWPTLMRLADRLGVRVHRTRPGELPKPVTDVEEIR
jgi:hypothetical protein